MQMEIKDRDTGFTMKVMPETIKAITEREHILSHVITQAISEANYLKELESINGGLLHDDFLDFKIVYRVTGVANGNQISYLIGSDLLDNLNVSESEVKTHAMENSMARTVFKPLAISCGKMSWDEYSQSEEEPKEWVITSNGEWGSGIIFYEGYVSELLRQFDADFYIIPSSIHELIVSPVTEDLDAQSLLTSLRSINDEIVNEADRLSYTLYFYDKGTRKITVYEAD